MPTVIGLDLGKKSFRAVEIDKTRKGVVVNKIGEYDSGRLDFDINSDESMKEYSSAISDFINENSFTTARCAAAMEEKDVFMRVVQLPKMSDKELSTSITYEAEQYVPLDLKDVNLTHQKIELNGVDEPHINVQLVAAKKSTVERYMQVLKKSKLVPVILEPEAISLGRALASSDMTDKASLILHIGFSKSLVVILFRGNVLFTRTLAMGGDTFTKLISQGLGLDYIQAEEYKKAYGIDKNKGDVRIFDALSPSLVNLISEIKRSQVFFTSRYNGVIINKVMLSGGTALLPGLLLHLVSNLDIEVELANPFKNVTFHKSLAGMKSSIIEKSPMYTVALGLALNEF